MSLQPWVQSLTPYKYGERLPRTVARLNTNESPYPPSPRVASAVAAAVSGLNRYPDPLASGVRNAAAPLWGVDPEMVLCGNGSDELLSLVVRAIVPEGGKLACALPDYPYYAKVAAAARATLVPLPLSELLAGRIPAETLDCALTLLSRPNSPTGSMIAADLLARWPTPLLIDEAYGDFAGETLAPWCLARGDVFVLRTMSKAYGLAGVRLGLLIASTDNISQLASLKETYNCDALAQAAAIAALKDQAYLRARISATNFQRERLREALARIGLPAFPSRANFVWVPTPDAAGLHRSLHEAGVLVRLLSDESGMGLRITVGTPAENDLIVSLLSARMQGCGGSGSRS